MMYNGPTGEIGPLQESTFMDQPRVPLLARMQGSMPGMSTTIGFGSFRGSNTMMFGGFMDDLGDPQKILSARKARRLEKRAAKHRIISGGNMTAAQESHFIGSASRRATALEAGKTPFLRSSRLNNASPRSLFSGHSQTIFAAEDANAYSMFGGYKMLNNKFGRGISEKIMGRSLAEGEKGFGAGLLSAITSGTRLDRLESRTLAGSARAAKKLAKTDPAISSMIKMNKPAGLFFEGGEFGRIIPKSANLGIVAPANTTVTRTAASLGGVDAATMTGNVGIRGDLIASSLSGTTTGFMAGFARGSLGYGQFTTGAAREGARMAEKKFVTAFGRAGLGTRSMAYEALSPGNLLKTLRASESGIIKGLAGIAAKGGGGALAARGLSLAIPGLNVLATASLVYDLGKMGGELIKSGINFARDANKSLQGSIAKPAFGMGYRDTEAAATSRARGVQAIQNSRLNARSMLGSEGAMMAAHYG